MQILLKFIVFLIIKNLIRYPIYQLQFLSVFLQFQFNWAEQEDGDQANIND